MRASLTTLQCKHNARLSAWSGIRAVSTGHVETWPQPLLLRGIRGCAVEFAVDVASKMG
jgi:hypothetical protein